jgi:hypothetical protein
LAKEELIMQGKARRMTYVPLVGLAVMLGLPGCAALTDESPNASMGGWCTDSKDIRVEDDKCGDYDAEGIASNPGYSYNWIPLDSDLVYPPMGGYTYQYIGRDKVVRKVTSGTAIARGLPKTSSSARVVQRGGFGIKSGTTSGTGGKAVAGKDGSVGS